MMEEKVLQAISRHFSALTLNIGQRKRTFFVVDQTLVPFTIRTAKWLHRYRLCKHPVDSRQSLNMGLRVYKKHIPHKLTYRSLVGQNYK
jgi:hypothetical protein